MKPILFGLGFGVLGLLGGILVGWTARGERRVDERRDGISGRERGTRGSASLASARTYNWMPKMEGAFLHPTTDEERAEVRRLIRAAIEQEHQFPSRMKAVCDLLALMTPENAGEIRDAFEESWKAGFNFTWERSVFFARYGEVMGAKGAEEFRKHSEFGRLLASWSTARPTDAIDWVNQMESGERQLEAIRWVMLGAGEADPKYGLQVFESMEADDQRALQRDLFNVTQRGGGVEGCVRLTADLLAREDPSLHSVGRYTLQRTFELLKGAGEEGLLAWLETLDQEHLRFLDPAALPKAFQSPATTPGPPPTER
jgi:hypothetical protein